MVLAVLLLEARLFDRARRVADAKRYIAAHGSHSGARPIAVHRRVRA